MKKILMLLICIFLVSCSSSTDYNQNNTINIEDDGSLKNVNINF